MVTLTLDSKVYPETAGHIRDAIKKGCPDIVTLQRNGSTNKKKVKKRRRESLKERGNPSAAARLRRFRPGFQRHRQAGRTGIGTAETP